MNRYFLKELVKEIPNLYKIFCVKGKVDDNKKNEIFFVNKFIRQCRTNTRSLNTRKFNNCPLRRGKTC